MKNVLNSILFISVFSLTYGQKTEETTRYCEDVSKHLKHQNYFYDVDETTLKSADTITDFMLQAHKLKIMGTVFLPDGITPAKNVILLIQQADDTGLYTLITDAEKAYVKNRLWVKTNNHGRYELFTFIPGSTNKPLTYPHELLPMHIHAMIKEPNKEAYALNTFLFDADPLVTKSCRKRLERKNIDSILELKTDGNLQVVTKNIVLESRNENI